MITLFGGDDDDICFVPRLTRRDCLFFYSMAHYFFFFFEVSPDKKTLILNPKRKFKQRYQYQQNEQSPHTNSVNTERSGNKKNTTLEIQLLT